VGERGVQISQRFASGLPTSSNQKGQGGCDAVATVEEEELDSWLGFGSLGRFAREGERKKKKRIRFGEFGQISLEFEKCRVLLQRW
jgi:hypothetical protein